MTKYETLSDLLTDLFTPHELLDWIRRLPHGETLPRSLSDRPLAILAADAEALLRRHDYEDAVLFESLVVARPRRAAEIRALEARLLVSKAGTVASGLGSPVAATQAQPSGSRFGAINNYGPSQQGDGNSMTVQMAAGGMIFNGPVSTSGGLVRPNSSVALDSCIAPATSTPPVNGSDTNPSPEGSTPAPAATR